MGASAEEAPAHPDTRVFTAGPAATRAFHDLLGIPPSLRADGSYRITTVGWVLGVLRVDLVGRSFGRLVLRLTAVEPNGHVKVGLDGPSRNVPLPVTRLVRTASRRLANTPLLVLLDFLRKDPATQEHPGMGVEAPPGTSRTGENSNPKPYAHEWLGQPSDLGPWGLFFDDLVFVFTAFTRVNFIWPIVHVFHGNHECLCVVPKFASRTAWMLNLPRRSSRPLAERVRRRLGMPPQLEDQPFKRLSTDLDDFDIVMGNEEKLQRAVELAVAGPKPRIVSLHKACLPRVTGDDVERPLRLARSTAQVEVLSQSMGHTHDRSLYAEEREYGSEETQVLKRLLLPPVGGRAAAMQGAARFDFVGYPDGADTEELALLLEDAGATINSILLPDVDVRVCLATPQPNLQVRFPNDYYQSAYDVVFDHLAPQVVTPAPPFGLAATEAWLREVASGLRLGEASTNAALARARDRIRPRWDVLAELSRDFRVGFVVDERVLPRLNDPTLSFGLSIPTMLREMGMSMVALCYAPDGDIRYAHHALDAYEIELRPFADEVGMHALLRDGEFRAVYSDRTFERRLTRHGKTHFGFADFEMGFQGALRTFERLVRVCSLPFFQRYHRYLDRGRA